MRPTKLTPAVQSALVEAVELGATWEAAAACAGIGPSTLREWRSRGAADEEPFAALLADLQKAEGRAISASLQVIRQAASAGQWQAAAWLLERRYPADYGRRTAVTAEVSTAATSADSEVAAALRRLRVPG